MIEKAGPAGRIAFIEFHDAEVKSVVIEMDGGADIQFTHLPVYHEIDTERYAVWSYTAVLRLTGVRSIGIGGPFEPNDYLSDALGTDDDGRIESGLIPIDQVIPLSAITLRFGSGRTVEVSCDGLRLVLQDAMEHTEDWVGPLSS
jgi:hypothetical protein